MSSRLVALLAALLALSACAASDPPTQRAASTAAVAAQRTLAENLVRARAEAQRLVGLVDLPDGTSFATVPRQLRSASTESSAEHQVNAHVVRRVPMSAAASARWLRAHPPRRLHHLGGGSTAQAGVVVITWSDYVDGASEPVSGDGWTQAALQITIAPLDARTSGWRVDGTAVALDPSPVRDEQPGPRIRAPASCPPHRPKAVGVRNDVRRLDEAIVPPEQPSSALVCRYGEAAMTGSADRLVVDATMDAGGAGRIADELRAAADLHFLQGPHSCPGDTGRRVSLVVLRYPSDDVALWVDESGWCGSVGNGSIRVPTGAVPEVLPERPGR